MNVVVGPSKYIREKDALRSIGMHLKKVANRVVIIGGKTSLSITKNEIMNSLLENNITLVDKPIWFGGESSREQIDRLVEELSLKNINGMIVVGGGKAIDTGKAVAYQLNLPLIAVPTIAATCAAATPISIIYDSDGMFIEISQDSKVPDVVLVDTTIISRSPYRYLVAGIGDTFAKWFESRASSKKHKETAFIRSAVALAYQIYYILIESGVDAIKAVKENKITDSLEEIIDTVILISGSVSGYGGEACRTAAAHAIYSGLTIFPETHQSYHGEIVAFGIIAQLVMESKAEEAKQLIEFYKQVELPITLKDIGVNGISDEGWKQLGEVTVQIEDMNNMPCKVTAEMVIASIQGADQLGRKSYSPTIQEGA